ncbi:MAG: redox-regulated ATPase YchF [Candidatus Bathyarchaeia archaeon]
MIRVGLIGKTNVGKTTFFNSATLLNAEMSIRPFTTRQQNVGVAYVSSLCVCREVGVQDNPKNSACVEGWRFVPIEIIDLPGLIRGAWMGKGLGNQFLNVAMQSDVLLHVVDASGSIDAGGELKRPGVGDPVQDVYDLEEELVMWFTKIIERNKDRITRMSRGIGFSLDRALWRMMSGMKVKREDVIRALDDLGFEREFSDWTEEDVKAFARKIREISKPTLIVANKMDLPHAEKNFERLMEAFKTTFLVPCSAESELALRRAEGLDLIKYVPGEETFRVVNEGRLSTRQSAALGYVQRKVFSRWMRTGVQFTLNSAVFKLLSMNAVYPVDDVNKLSDKDGNVLPDVLLIPPDSTVHDLARQIHTELAKTMVCAIDARTGLRLPKNYVVRDRDIIKIVAAAERR